jgi:outer membrane protein TolC
VQHGDTLRLTLAQARSLAAANHPAVQAARARVAQSEARVLQSRSALLPHVSAYAADGPHTMNTATFGLDFPTAPGEPPLFDPDGQVIGPIHIVDARGQLSQALFDWSSVQRTRGARAALSASAADVEATASEAASAAAVAYVRALRAQAKVAAREADIRLAQDLVAIAESQVEAGVGVALDITRARARLAGLQAQLIADRNEVSHAQLALTDAVGVSADQPVVLADSLESAVRSAADAETAVSTALSQRQDLQALESRMRAAELSARAIRAERLPTLRLTGDEGFIGKDWGNLLNTYSWNLQVSVPIFQGYGLSARRQEQSAVVSELAARRTDLRREIERQVRDALLDRRSAEEQVAAARASVDLATQQVEQARERFTSGVAGNADLVEATLVLSNARSLYVDALAAYALSDVALARAQGNPGTN